MTEAPPRMSMAVTMILVAKQKKKKVMCATLPHRASAHHTLPMHQPVGCEHLDTLMAGSRTLLLAGVARTHYGVALSCSPCKVFYVTPSSCKCASNKKLACRILGGLGAH